MNTKTTITIMPVRLLAMALMAAGTLTIARGATALNGQIVLSPVTAHEESAYAVSSTNDLSGGLSNVGIGTTVYLEADVNIAVTDVTSVVWSLAGKPSGSAAALTSSPLGTNVPVYEPSSQLVSKSASRMLLRPDLEGQYTVTATITTTHEGTTNISQAITASTYVGDQVCYVCHYQNAIAVDEWSPWSQTLHAQVFSNEIDADGPYFTGETFMSQSCLQCHTTGYDVRGTNAPDGGFYDLQQIDGWTIPTVLTNGNYASMQAHYPSLAALANVQCESCHGPGHLHAIQFGVTNNNPNWPSIAVSENSGDCNQCHDDSTHHPYGTEWLNSVHAVVTTVPAGKTSCVGCHTDYGFQARLQSITNGISTMTNYFTITTNNNLSYAPINCQTCHEPHGNTIPTNNPHMIRTLASVTLIDGTVVTNAGEGLLCMECHQSRAAAANAASNDAGSIMTCQADMLEGVNGYTYGQAIPSSAHAAITNTCITCHMQIIPSTDPAFLYAGSHTFNVSWAGTATNSPEYLVAACQQCHGPSVTSFNFPVEDFDGAGVTEGVQTQVQTLLNEVAELLPGGINNVIANKISPSASWTSNQLEAAYNYDFVQDDGSLGVHNTAYTVGLLQASIANLTGTSVPGGLPDSWVDEYFGSVTNPAAAPDAINNTNGVPNWMMYALGLNPTQSGFNVTNGVVWVDGQDLVNGGGTNSIHIYRAAEVSFNTAVGNSYQIQGITQLSGGWQNIGNPITGTGSPISYLTSMRNNPQMFFRVLTNP